MELGVSLDLFCPFQMDTRASAGSLGLMGCPLSIVLCLLPFEHVVSSLCPALWQYGQTASGHTWCTVFTECVEHCTLFTDCVEQCTVFTECVELCTVFMECMKQCTMDEPRMQDFVYIDG
eukprot:1149683-Pelagomonas_calceolata.AAC.8